MAPSSCTQPTCRCFGSSVGLSVFIAPDLVPEFADEPWIDTLPGVDAQADLLVSVVAVKPEASQTALASSALP